MAKGDLMFFKKEKDLPIFLLFWNSLQLSFVIFLHQTNFLGELIKGLNLDSKMNHLT